MTQVLSLSSSSLPLDSLKEVSVTEEQLEEEEEEGTPTKCETPTPFPVSSQIGSGNLSRSGSLRRASRPEAGTDTTNSSERSSPSSPPGSAASSSHSSPARYKITVGGGANRKLVSTRSSPQLTAGQVLKEIHEEAEDAAGSGASSPVATRSDASAAAAGALEPDPVDTFPSSRAGAVVIRRLEHRRCSDFFYILFFIKRTALLLLVHRPKKSGI